MNCPKCNSANVAPAAGMMRCQDCEHYFDRSTAETAAPMSIPNARGSRLMQCPACGHQVSAKAANCPSCAEPLRSAVERAKIGNILKWSFFAIAVGVIIFFSIREVVQNDKRADDALDAVTKPYK